MPAVTSALLAKRARLAALLQERTPLLVAYSGGVDSAFLLAEAHQVLGEGVRGVLADSPSLPRQALRAALALAEERGIPVEIVHTEEMAQAEYTENPPNRCYFCKAELFRQMERLAARGRFRALAYGENADDLRQVRPGRTAAAEFAVTAPLREAELGKEEIRELSRALGLPTAEAPAQPCLSSRIPHGTPVTREALGMVERGEEWVRSLGFRVFRVRHLAGEDGPRARVLIAPGEMGGMEDRQAELEGGLRAVGYRGVEVDPEGYRG